jgi:hypothetical protein
MSNRQALLSVIPPRTVGSLARWVFEAIPPGGFVSAVIRSDLFEAVARADDDNRRTLVELVQLIRWYVPHVCVRDDEPMVAWPKDKYDAVREELHADPQFDWLKDYLNA